MFILANYISNRRKKIEDWETAKSKWLDKNEYRFESQWNREHPYPIIRFERYVQFAVIGVLILVFAFFMFSIVASGVEADKKDMNATKDGATCRMFNKNDHVNIQSGDYENIMGTIVGGCNNGEDYQVKIDDGQKADVPGDGLDAVDVGGKIVPVGSYKHLVVVDVK